MADFEERCGIIACQTPWGRWYQTVDEIIVEVNVIEGTKGKEINIEFSAKKFKLVHRGEILLQGTLPHSIRPDESTWTLEDNKLLQVVLAKSDPVRSPAWKSLLEDQYVTDPVLFDQMEQKVVLQKIQLGNPGFDFDNASVSGTYSGMRDLKT